MAQKNLRQSSRKIFKTIVKMTLQSGASYSTQSQDIASEGLSVIIEGRNIKAGELCAISFEIVTDNKPFMIKAVAKIIYSVCTQNGFRLGLQFVQIDSECTSALMTFLG